MILSSMIIIGGGLALGLTRRPTVDLSGTGRALRETYADTPVAPLPADMKRQLRNIEPLLKIVRKDA